MSPKIPTMALFALPIAPSSTNKQSAETKSTRYKLTLPSRKRKRGSESPPESENENSLSDDDNLPPSSTNPLSLAPAEILQYQLAGLELNQHLPTDKDFPHRGLPARRASATKKRKDWKGKSHTVDPSDEEEEEPRDDDEDYINSRNPPQGSRLRMQHFRVLVAILHKCLLEGDIKRALRSWTILLRVQFGGQMLDIRSTGYWAIGAELLARSEDSTQPVPNDHEEEEEPRRAKSNALSNGEKEWGTKAGRTKAVSYLGSMVLEFPLNKGYWRTISAVDFWPSMLAIELYGIQYEQREALEKINLLIENVESGDESDGSDEDEDSGHMSDDSYNVSERRIARRKYRKDVEIWKSRDEVRKNTLAAAESVVARVDELLNDPLYTGNITISEIRAHMALYVGDLGVPDKYPELENEEEDERGTSSQQNQRDTQRRMLYRQRINEFEAGIRNRKKEIARATTIVKNIIKSGGTVNGFKDIYLEGVHVND